MRSYGTSLNTAIGTGSTSLARACLITRVDTVEKRFAAIQADTSFASNTFTAVAGIAFSNLPFRANEGSTRASIEIAANASATLGLDADEISAGLYDAAQVLFYVCDHVTPANGLGTLFAGNLGEVKLLNRGRAIIECVGILGKSKTIIVEHRTPVCRNWLYDSNCTVSEGAYKTTTTVSSASGFTVTFAGGSAVDDYYNLGFARFTSGASKGRVYEIRDWVGSTKVASFYLPPDATVAPGDTVELLPGCDYTTGALGCGKYSNILNFRGEPHVPGQDARNINYSTWGGA